MSLPEPLGSPRRGRPALERSRHVAVRSGDGRPEVSWCADGGVGRVGRVAGDAGRPVGGGHAPAAAPGHPGRARPAGVALLRRAVRRPAARDDGAATAAAGDQAAADGALRRLGDRPGRDPRRRRGVRRRPRQHRGGPARPVRRVHDLGLHRRADPAGAGPPGHRGDDRPRVRPDRWPAHAPPAGRHPAPRRPAGGGLRHRRPLPHRGDVRAAAAGARGCGGGWRGSSP